MNDDKLAKSLDLEIIDKSIQQVMPKEVKSNGNEHDIDNDYKYARQNLYGIIENGSRALEDLLDIAQQSQHPRAYEVISTLIKTLADANKDLLNVQKQVKDLSAETGEKNPHTVNNNLYVGSTAELMKIIKNNAKE